MEQESDVDIPRSGRAGARRARVTDVLSGFAVVLAVLALVLSPASKAH